MPGISPQPQKFVKSSRSHDDASPFSFCVTVPVCVYQLTKRDAPTADAYRPQIWHPRLRPCEESCSLHPCKGRRSNERPLAYVITCARQALSSTLSPVHWSRQSVSRPLGQDAQSSAIPQTPSRHATVQVSEVEIPEMDNVKDAKRKRGIDDTVRAATHPCLIGGPRSSS